MSFTIKPLEQLLAEGATLLALKAGDKTPADEYNRAQVALVVAGIFSAYGAGDFTSLSASLASAVGAVKDPATAQLVSDVLGVAQNVYTLTSFLPNAVAEAIAANIGKGMTAIASVVPKP